MSKKAETNAQVFDVVRMLKAFGFWMIVGVLCYVLSRSAVIPGYVKNLLCAINNYESDGVAYCAFSYLRFELSVKMEVVEG